MPRGFSEREREHICARLMEQGRAYFSTYGVRRTNVEDLTRAAGISKGAFYLFFTSKEELYVELLQQFEAEFQARVLREIAHPAGAPREHFKQVLERALSTWSADPLFRRFDTEEYEYLLRKLSAEKAGALMRSDDLFAAQMIAAWQAQGTTINCAPPVFAALLRGFFILTVRRGDLGDEAFPQMFDLLLEMTARYLVAEPVPNGGSESSMGLSETQ